MRRSATWAVTAAGMALAWLAGRDRLRVRDPWQLSCWQHVVHASGPAVAAVAALRLAALVAGGYLVVLLALAELGRLPRVGRRVTAVVARLPAGRLVAAQVAGAVGVVALSAPAFAGAAGPAMRVLAADPAPVMRVLPQPAPVAPPQVVPATTTPTPITSPPPEPLPAPPPTAPSTAAAAAPAVPPAAPSAPAADAVVLERGDSLWSVAAARVAARLGRTPTDDEIGPYWERVVQANRAQLPDPADPDFVLPGMRVVVPPG